MRERFRRWRHAPTADLSFLTPASFANDAVGADRYLTHKFDLHRCPEDEGDERRLGPTSTLIQHGSRLSTSLVGC
jgi:hypothetical protein